MKREQDAYQGAERKPDWSPSAYDEHEMERHTWIVERCDDEDNALHSVNQAERERGALALASLRMVGFIAKKFMSNLALSGLAHLSTFSYASMASLMQPLSCSAEPM